MNISRLRPPRDVHRWKKIIITVCCHSGMLQLKTHLRGIEDDVQGIATMCTSVCGFSHYLFNAKHDITYVLQYYNNNNNRAMHIAKVVCCAMRKRNER